MPSSGSSQIVSRLKFSPSLTTSRIAGVRYIAAITIGSATARSRAPAASSNPNPASAVKKIGGEYCVAR